MIIWRYAYRDQRISGDACGGDTVFSWDALRPSAVWREYGGTVCAVYQRDERAASVAVLEYISNDAGCGVCV